jgi:hypothetical protein
MAAPITLLKTHQTRSLRDEQLDDGIDDTLVSLCYKQRSKFRDTRHGFELEQ